MSNFKAPNLVPYVRLTGTAVRATGTRFCQFTHVPHTHTTRLHASGGTRRGASKRVDGDSDSDLGVLHVVLNQVGWDLVSALAGLDSRCPQGTPPEVT